MRPTLFGLPSSARTRQQRALPVLISGAGTDIKCRMSAKGRDFMTAGEFEFLLFCIGVEADGWR
jgi:hypothetical protein